MAVFSRKKKKRNGGTSLGNQAPIFKRFSERNRKERKKWWWWWWWWWWFFFSLSFYIFTFYSILFDRREEDTVCYSHEDQHGIFGGARQISIRRNQKSDTGFESSGNRHLETAHHRLRFLRDNLGDCFVRLPRQHLRGILKREKFAWWCDGRAFVSMMKRIFRN